MNFRLDSDDACIWWTFDDWARAERARKDERLFGAYVLQADRIPSFVIRTGQIVFDKPDSWKESRIPATVILEESGGYWSASGAGWILRAVRAETPDGTVLTGRINESVYGSGPFILVLPRAESLRVWSRSAQVPELAVAI